MTLKCRHFFSLRRASGAHYHGASGRLLLLFMAGARTRTDTKVTVLVAVLVPCGVLLLAALAALAVWRHQTYRSVLHGGVRAPGAGPNTTLLITGG